LTNTAQFAPAIVVLEELVAQEPRSTEGRYRLGQAYSFAGRSADAVRTFEQLVAHDPECSAGWFGLSKAQARRGHTDRSREALERFQAVTFSAPTFSAPTGFSQGRFRL
jgi:predicted Zn-dependent protease